jgi:hypothetical protein
VRVPWSTLSKSDSLPHKITEQGPNTLAYYTQEQITITISKIFMKFYTVLVFNSGLVVRKINLISCRKIFYNSIEYSVELPYKMCYNFLPNFQLYNSLGIILLLVFIAKMPAVIDSEFLLHIYLFSQIALSQRHLPDLNPRS